MDSKMKGALDAVNVTQAGIVLALAALAEVLIEEKIIDAERLIAHLEKPSEVLQRAGAGEAGAMALNGMIAYLRLSKVEADLDRPLTH